MYEKFGRAGKRRVTDSIIDDSFFLLSFTGDTSFLLLTESGREGFVLKSAQRVALQVWKLGRIARTLRCRFGSFGQHLLCMQQQGWV